MRAAAARLVAHVWRAREGVRGREALRLSPLGAYAYAGLDGCHGGDHVCGADARVRESGEHVRGGREPASATVRAPVQGGRQPGRQRRGVRPTGGVEVEGGARCRGHLGSGVMGGYCVRSELGLVEQSAKLAHQCTRRLARGPPEEGGACVDGRRRGDVRRGWRGRVEHVVCSNVRAVGERGRQGAWLTLWQEDRADDLGRSKAPVLPP